VWNRAPDEPAAYTRHDRNAEKRLPCGLCAVEADAAQMQQVVMNLIINASEAIGEDTAWR